jgi:4-amino-4-deoxy-L-arabinose transferase-like glycosyltransferase
MSDRGSQPIAPLELAGVGLVLAAHLAVAWALRDSYNFLDEAGYLENGRQLLQGWVPYVHYRDPHMPGLMVAAAAAFKAMGVHLATARALIAAVNAAVLLSTWWLVRRLDRPAVAWATMLLLAVLTYTSAHRGFLLLIEPFLTLAAVGCFGLLWRFRAQGRRRDLVGSALVFGAALLFKQSYVFLALPAPYLVWRYTRALGRDARRAATDAGLWVACAAIPGALLVLIYAAGGHADRLLADTVLFHLIGPGWSTAVGIHAHLHPWWYFTPYLVLPLSLALDRGMPRDRVLQLWAFLFAGAMVAFPRFEFFHLLPMLPFLAYMAARLLWGVSAERIVANGQRRRSPGALAAFLAATLVAAAAFGWIGTIGDPQFGRGFERQREVGQWVGEHTPEGGTIFVFPMMPTISFYSGLPLATRNIDLEPSTLLADDLERVLADLEESRPLYVVYMPGARFDDEPVEDWGQGVIRYLEDHYEEQWRAHEVFPGYCDTAIVMRRKGVPLQGSGGDGGTPYGHPNAPVR